MRIICCIVLFVSTIFAIEAADIIVKCNQKVGLIKAMNAVNNGPIAPRVSQCRDNFKVFKDARIPFVRTHDTSFSESYGGNHVVDISSIFPDFSKNPEKEESYDFALTDVLLQTIMKADSKVFFRLGQKIEHYIKKYDIFPPKDFKKWAIICEHVISHYNEGWANGHKWNIKYWEIWNEPDLDIKQWKTNPRTWGSDEQTFYKFYKTAALHLKKRFPDLKIGGPALAGNEKWADSFLEEMAKEKVPFDFFSWHIYTSDPYKIADTAKRIKALLIKHGYNKTESILNEWNYIRNWNTDFQYSMEVARNAKGGAFNAATMIDCQNEEVDMLMYYDARPETPFNGLFDFYTMNPTRAYYPFYIWSKLRYDYGSQLMLTSSDKDVHAIAAQGKNGNLGILITRYNDNDNITTPKKIKITLEGKEFKTATSHITNDYYINTEVPLEIHKDQMEILIDNNSYLFIETK